VSADSAPATKADLKEVESRLDAKIDGVEERLDAKISGVDKSLGSRINGIAGELVKTNAKMDRMHEEIMSGLRDFRGELLKAFEDAVVKGKRYEDKALTHADQLQSHEARLQDHEKRLHALEPRGAS